MSILNKEGKESKPETAQEPPSFTIKVSGEKPEMAMVPGGLFVVSIPLNSPKVNNTIALGWLETAKMKLWGQFQAVDALKAAKADAEAQKNAGIIQRAAAGVKSLLH